LYHAKTLAALAAAILLYASAIEARPHRVTQVPNGTNIGCVLCHLNPGGGGARNPFGGEIENGFLSEFDVVWGPELAALDSDGDGATNGQELLDADGLWAIGDDNPGNVDDVTLAGDDESFPPPPVATAVGSSTWAQVKSAFRDLVD